MASGGIGWAVRRIAFGLSVLVLGGCSREPDQTRKAEAVARTENALSTIATRT